MTTTQHIRTIAAALGVAAALAPSAFAGGEPKNEWPFTRPVGDRTPQAATHRSSQAGPPIQGEPKNQPPFVRPATVVIASSSRFSWTDTALGGIGGIGASLAGAGALALRRARSPRLA